MPKTYTVKDIATILGFSTNSIYSFLKAKRIKGVRVGKGRFRIPEEELARILHLSKKPVSQSVSSVGIEDKDIVPVVADIAIPVQITPTTVLEPNLFDWFIGIASVISGIALFLFNVSSQGEIMGRLIPVIRILLICGGLGLIASSIQEQSNRLYVFFQSIMISIGVMGAYGLMRGSDMVGAILFGSISVIILLSIIRKLPAELSMGYFITLLSFGTALGVILRPEQIMTKSVVSLFPLPTVVVQGILLSVVLFTTSLYWIGYVKKSRWVFAIGCAMYGIAFVFAAMLYGEFLYWSRSFFYLVLAFFCLFLPVSLMLEPTKSQRQRLYLHVFFGGMGGLLTLGIIMISSLHQMLLQQRVHDFKNKIVVGQTIVENAIANVKSSVMTASGNPDFFTTIQTHDTDALVRNAKVVYEGNPMIRRLVFLKANGDVVTVYPYGVLERRNYAFREYFTRVRDTKALYVSNVFESSSNEGKRSVVSVVAPLLDTKGEFIGVMVASVNLEKVALQLQQTAHESGGEFFTLVDQTGKYVIHPNTALIGSQAPLIDLMLRGIEKKHGIENARLSDGTVGLVAYDGIPSLGWGLSIQVPITAILALSAYTLLLMFGTLFGVFVIAIVFLCVMKFRWLPQQRGYS